MQKHFFKSFNMSKGIYNSQIFMIHVYLKLGDTTDIA